jgi:hypothetical protein
LKHPAAPQFDDHYEHLFVSRIAREKKERKPAASARNVLVPQKEVKV